MDPGCETLLPAYGQLPHRICLEHVAAVEIGAPALLAPVARVGGSPGVGCAERATGSRSDGIHGLIVNGLSISVRDAGQQTAAEALS